MKLKTLFTPEWITPTDDSGASYKIRALTGVEQCRFRSGIVQKGDKIIFDEDAITAAKDCVTEWKGIEDEKGVPLAYSKHSFDFLPWAHIEFIASEVFVKNFFKEDETKNS